MRTKTQIRFREALALSSPFLPRVHKPEAASSNTGGMTHGSFLRTCTCMRRIAADKGAHVFIGEQHQVAEDESSCLVPSMTSGVLICMLIRCGDVL